MGHGSIRVTLDTYGHLFDGLDDAAADALEDSYREARESVGHCTVVELTNQIPLAGERPFE